jgi:hypothetical protein
VNESAHRVTAHQSQQPKHRQYYRNGPQHMLLLSTPPAPGVSRMMTLCISSD